MGKNNIHGPAGVSDEFGQIVAGLNKWNLAEWDELHEPAV
jgi:hypothetical protein